MHNGRAERPTIVGGNRTANEGNLISGNGNIATNSGTGILIGAQDCHMQHNGAFTGDISSELIADTGATYVIVGHSERRQHHAETDALVAAKFVAAQSAGLVPILCVGETLAERDAGQTESVSDCGECRSIRRSVADRPAQASRCRSGR